MLTHGGSAAQRPMSLENDIRYLDSSWRVVLGIGDTPLPRKRNAHPRCARSCAVGVAIHYRDAFPILLAYPNAKILLLNLNGYLPVNYEDTEHYQLTRRVPNETDEALKDVSLTCEVTHPLPHGRGSVRCSDFSASTHSMAY